jgi:hypothetical protein
MAGKFGPSASSLYTAPTVLGWGNACGSNATSAVLPGASPTTTIATGQYYDVGPFREFTTETRVGCTSAVTNNVVTASSVTTVFVGTLTCGATAHNTSGSNAEAGAVGEAFLAFTTTKPAETTVSGQAVTTGGSMTVASGAVFPGTPFYAQLNNEVILVGTVSTNVLTISRAQNGSSTNNAAIGDGVSLGNIPGAAATNPNSGDLFAHAGFTNLALNTGDSIQFTWNISVTS